MARFQHGGVTLILERSTSEGWLSNSYLVADRPGGSAVIIDTGGPPEPILEKVRELSLTVTHVLCTHHHADHIQHNGIYRARFGCALGAHPLEGEKIGGLDLEIGDGGEIVTGGLRIRALHTPGHTRGMLAFVAGERRVFPGDTLFRGSVGGTLAPGHGTFEELRRSILEVLMGLPGGMELHPGHGDASTIGEEWERNPFIRAWRGLDPVADEPCLAFGRPAILLLRARDYDGGFKCWVRFEDDGGLEVVPGSQVRGS